MMIMIHVNANSNANANANFQVQRVTERHSVYCILQTYGGG
jgi:hypothetical protein